MQLYCELLILYLLPNIAKFLEFQSGAPNLMTPSCKNRMRMATSFRSGARRQAKSQLVSASFVLYLSTAPSTALQRSSAMQAPEGTLKIPRSFGAPTENFASLSSLRELLISVDTKQLIPYETALQELKRSLLCPLWQTRCPILGGMPPRPCTRTCSRTLRLQETSSADVKSCRT